MIDTTYPRKNRLTCLLASIFIVLLLVLLILRLFSRIFETGFLSSSLFSLSMQQAFINKHHFRDSRRLLAPVDKDKILLFRALKAVQNHSNIIFFGGKQVKAMFDSENPRPHLFLHNRMFVRAWKTVAQHINDTFVSQKKHASTQHWKAVHVHNEFPLGDLVLTVLEEYRRSKLLRFPKPPQVFNITKDQVLQSMHHYQPPIVLTNSVDENWGFFSTVIVNRTTKWINMTNHLILHHANHETVKYILESDKIVLVLVSTHVDPKFGYHPKVISLPLGVKARLAVWQKARLLLALNYTKVYLISINNSGWGSRTEINTMIAKAFNNTVRNTYSRAMNARRKKIKLLAHNSSEEVTVVEDHMVEIARSKFVLCPSGLGFDTYRLWEVLLLGSIPIVESSPGLDRTYASLPVLVVRNFNQVTPAFLESAYKCFVDHAHDFKFNHLREDYWLGIIFQALLTARISHITEHHPFRNKYCDFLG